MHKWKHKFQQSFKTSKNNFGKQFGFNISIFQGIKIFLGHSQLYLMEIIDYVMRLFRALLLWRPHESYAQKEMG